MVTCTFTFSHHECHSYPRCHRLRRRAHRPLSGQPSTTHILTLHSRPRGSIERKAKQNRDIAWIEHRCGLNCGCGSVRLRVRGGCRRPGKGGDQCHSPLLEVWRARREVRGTLAFRLLPTAKSNLRVHAARACAMHGVHYVDITPEPHFIADIVTKCVFVILWFGLARKSM